MTEHIGSLVVQEAISNNPKAVARVHVYGPRGGIIGSVLIDRDYAQEAAKLLSKMAGTKATKE